MNYQKSGNCAVWIFSDFCPWCAHNVCIFTFIFSKWIFSKNVPKKLYFFFFEKIKKIEKKYLLFSNFFYKVFSLEYLQTKNYVHKRGTRALSVWVWIAEYFSVAWGGPCVPYRILLYYIIYTIYTVRHNMYSKVYLKRSLKLPLIRLLSLWSFLFWKKKLKMYSRRR